MSSRINKIEQRIADLETAIESLAMTISELEFKLQRKKRADAGRKRNPEYRQGPQG